MPLSLGPRVTTVCVDLFLCFFFFGFVCSVWWVVSYSVRIIMKYVGVVIGIIAVFWAVSFGEQTPTGELSAPVAVIGGGLAGLTCALELRRIGYEHVVIYEKRATVGGRVGRFVAGDSGVGIDPWVFDIGPSWYWMPRLFEAIFTRFSSEIIVDLERIDPAYRMYVEGGKFVDIPGTGDGLLEWVEEEWGITCRLGVEKMFVEGQIKNELSMKDWLWRRIGSVGDLLTIPSVLWAAVVLDMFGSVKGHVARHLDGCKHAEILEIVLSWPVIFLGVSPSSAPAVYSMVTYSGHMEGTWYPRKGGISSVTEELEKLAVQNGVLIKVESEVVAIDCEEETGRAERVVLAGGDVVDVGAVVCAGDYFHCEQHLLPSPVRLYSEEYWGRIAMSPSCLLFYAGFDKSIPGLLHHTYFFDSGLQQHLEDVFESHTHSERPTFYVSAVSKTDDFVAPQGGETVVFLVPLSPRLNGTDTEEIRDDVFEHLLKRLEGNLNVSSLKSSLKYYRSFGPADFANEYNAFRGNAFGLGNVLSQSLMFKPAMDSSSPNIVFAGHMTQPGPGMPPAMISGIVAASVLDNKMRGMRNGKSGFAFVLDLLTEEMAFCFLVWISFFHIFVISLISCTCLYFWGWKRSRSYFYCCKILYSHGKTYWMASLLMDISSFLDTAALYALFRVSDDIVDEVGCDGSLRLARLKEFEEEFFCCMAGGVGKTTHHEIIPAVIETVKRLDIETSLFHRFFKSMKADAMNVIEYQTMSELFEYMDGSAAVIGEFMLYILAKGCCEEDLRHMKQGAGDLGRAFQLTNMIRDIKEDLILGRIYIPLEKCTQYGVDLKAMLSASEARNTRDGSEEWIRLIEGMFLEADKLYESGVQAIKLLPERSQAVVRLAAALYRDIHSAIRGANYLLFSKPRISVGFFQKLNRAIFLLPCQSSMYIAFIQSFIKMFDILSFHSLPFTMLLAIWWATNTFDPSAFEASYVSIHCIFTLPCIAVLYTFSCMKCSSPYLKQVMLWSFILCVVANAYTVPWDNFMIAKGVWSYDNDRIIPIHFGYCPYEEYAFFTLETLIVVGIWLFYFPSRKSFCKFPEKFQGMPGHESMFGTVCAALLLFFSFAITWIQKHALLYLGYLFVWAIPILLLQWICGWRALLAHWDKIMPVIGFSSFCLCLVNRWGIRHGIWKINDDNIVPLARNQDMPLEEGLFYVLTTTMCVFGITLGVLLSECMRKNENLSLWKCLTIVSLWGQQRVEFCKTNLEDILTFYIPNAIAIGSTVLVRLQGDPSLSVQVMVFLSGIVVVGIPHGALDHELLAGFGKLVAWNTITSAHGHLAYIALAFVTMFSWFAFPWFSFVSFLVVSVFHFGEGDVQKRDSFSDWLEIVVRGCMFCVGLYHRPGEGLYLSFCSIVHGESEMQVMPIHVTLVNLVYRIHILALMVVILHRLKRGGEFHIAFELVVLHLMFAQLPLLLSFSIYFSLYHSCRHVVRIFRFSGSCLKPVTMLYSIPVVFAIVLTSSFLTAQSSAIDLQDFPWFGRLWKAFIIGIASLTTPHMLMVMLMSEYEKKSRKLTSWNKKQD